MRARIEALDASLMFAPDLLTTSNSAVSMALRTPESDVFVPVTSSAINGSTRGVKVIKVPSAWAARDRKTSLEGSANDLAKVRCSWGRNGLRNRGIFSSKLFKVSKIAPIQSLEREVRGYAGDNLHLTSTERSETTRIRGPVT